jgi:predicted RNA-binding protein with PUA-like domain
MIEKAIKKYTGLDVEHVERPNLSRLNPGKIHLIYIRNVVPSENEILGIEEIFTQEHEDYTLLKSTRFYNQDFTTLTFVRK